MGLAIKMCGNRSATDLINAANAGADLLGIIFADAWRRITVEHATEMVAKLRGEADNVPPVVGVFVDQPVNEVNKTARQVGLDMVQLHGTETPEYWEQIETATCHCAAHISRRFHRNRLMHELSRVVTEFAQRD